MLPSPDDTELGAPNLIGVVAIALFGAAALAALLLASGTALATAVLVYMFSGSLILVTVAALRVALCPARTCVRPNVTRPDSLVGRALYQN